MERVRVDGTSGIKSLLVALLIGAAILMSRGITDTVENDANTGADKELTVNGDYRQAMRVFVQNISAYARATDPDFIVIPQNDHELLTETCELSGPLSTTYVNAMDGIYREDLFYGYEGDNVSTPESDREEMVAFIMDLAETNGVACW